MHPANNNAHGVFIYAEWLGRSCSACAPRSMSKEDVEAAAADIVKPAFGHWRAVDKSQPPISIGEPTPSSCNVAEDRQHWFLVSGEL